MNKRQASMITGGLSRPGKMPEGSISLPARACNMGSKLRKVPGSVCAACYAHEGRYGTPVVQTALERRLWAPFDEDLKQ